MPCERGTTNGGTALGERGYSNDGGYGYSAALILPTPDGFAVAFGSDFHTLASCGEIVQGG